MPILRVMREKRYTTNGLARAAGCTRKALRVYQAHGLMKRPEKTWQACFDDTAVDRLRLIMTLRQAGMSIVEERPAVMDEPVHQSP